MAIGIQKAKTIGLNIAITIVCMIAIANTIKLLLTSGSMPISRRPKSVENLLITYFCPKLSA